MDVLSASVFLIGSILLSLSMMVLVLAIVVANNLIYKFWKPIKIYAYHTVTTEETPVIKKK